MQLHCWSAFILALELLQTSDIGRFVEICRKSVGACLRDSGAGVGVKLPFAAGRFATRLEANFAHVFSTGGDNRLGLLFGVSYFCR